MINEINGFGLNILTKLHITSEYLEGYFPLSFSHVHLDGFVIKIGRKGVLELRIIQRNNWKESSLFENIVDKSTIP
jgi:hypothetical protein